LGPILIMLYTLEMKKNMNKIPVYEKEIYSDVIPLSKREIKGVINRYCKISNLEPQRIVPSYVIGNQGNKLLVYYLTELTELPVFEFPNDDPFYYLFNKKPDDQIKPPDYLGYVDMQEIKAQIEIPIRIRIVSYHAELDLWWVRLTENIIKKLHTDVPSFIPKFDANISSINSGNLPTNSIVNIFTNDLDPDSVVQKYGTYREFTLVEVRGIVARCKAFQNEGGTIAAFYYDVLGESTSSKFSLETLKSWVKDNRFKP